MNTAGGPRSSLPTADPGSFTARPPLERPKSMALGGPREGNSRWRVTAIDPGRASKGSPSAAPVHSAESSGRFQARSFSIGQDRLIPHERSPPPANTQYVSERYENGQQTD